MAKNKKQLNTLDELTDSDTPTIEQTEAFQTTDPTNPVGMIVPMTLAQLEPDPDNERIDILGQELRDLAQNIRNRGMLEPIQAYRSPANPDKWRIKSGHRRYAAAQLANVETVPVLVIAAPNDNAELSVERLLLNFHRQDLSPIEQAQAMKRILNLTRWTQAELGQALGVSQSQVANNLRMLALPEPVRNLLQARRIGQGHAVQLMFIKSPEVDLNGEITADVEAIQQRFAKMAAEKMMSVAALHDAVETYLREQKERQEAIARRNAARIDDNGNSNAPTKTDNVAPNAIDTSDDAAMTAIEEKMRTDKANQDRQRARGPIARQALRQAMQYDPKIGPTAAHIKLAVMQFADMVYQWKPEPPTGSNLPKRIDLNKAIEAVQEGEDIPLLNILADLSREYIIFNSDNTMLSTQRQGEYADKAFNINKTIEHTIKDLNLAPIKVDKPKAPNKEKNTPIDPKDPNLISNRTAPPTNATDNMNAKTVHPTQP